MAARRHQMQHIKLDFYYMAHNPVKALWFYCSQNFKLFGFPIFWF